MQKTFSNTQNSRRRLPAIIAAFSFAALSVPSVAGTITPTPGTSLVSVSYSGTPSQVDNFFVYHVVDANGVTHEGANNLGNLLPGVTPNPATFAIPYGVASGYGTIIGIYSLTTLTSGFASVAMNSVSGAAAIGQPFASVFGGANEAAVVTSLINGDAASLIAFLNANSSLFPSFNGVGTAISASNVHFSDGAAAGSFGLSILSGTPTSATPEPSTFLLAGPVLFFLLRRKRS